MYTAENKYLVHVFVKTDRKDVTEVQRILGMIGWTVKNISGKTFKSFSSASGDRRCKAVDCI